MYSGTGEVLKNGSRLGWEEKKTYRGDHRWRFELKQKKILYAWQGIRFMSSLIQ